MPPRRRWTSTSPTRTETFSPARAISCGSFLASSYLLLFSFLQNVDLWIKPLVSTPTSTKMPNWQTFLTTPDKIWPFFKVDNVSAPERMFKPIWAFWCWIFVFVVVVAAVLLLFKAGTTFRRRSSLPSSGLTSIFAMSLSVFSSTPISFPTSALMLPPPVANVSNNDASSAHFFSNFRATS